jgi:hypothetical protein
VEFHLEQGPQLEAAGLSLGVVSGIAGQTWLHIAVEGVQNHGGEHRVCGLAHWIPRVLVQVLPVAWLDVCGCTWLWRVCKTTEG